MHIMAKAIDAGIALVGAVCALWPVAASARHYPKRIVAEARFGMMTSRSPRIGPQLVRRGGYTAVNDMVRPRFTGGMVDIYPTTKVGLRFSVGTRYFARANFWLAAEQATRGILFDPHMTRGGRGLIRNFRRYTPVATVGYDISPANGLVIGIEGGALSGRAIPTVRTPRMGFGAANRDRPGLNKVVNLSARIAF